MTGFLISGIPELFFLTLAFICGGGDRFAAILAAALVHELGHICTAAVLGVKMRLCRTGIAGVSIRYDFSAVSHLREAAICIAGPLTGIAVFLLCHKNGCTSYFAGASAALALFNLLPVSYLDGGCVLSALLSCFLPPDTVWYICRVLSVIFTLGLWCTAVFVMLRCGGDISVMAVSIYLIYRLFSEY